MLLTFKNTKKTNNIKVIDMFSYIMSQGAAGFTNVQNSNNEFITVELEKITPYYKDYYNQHVRLLFNLLEQEIDTFLATHPTFALSKKEFYTEFKIPKKKKDKNGKTRWRKLINPHPHLKAIQKKIAETLENSGIIPHNAAHAFRTGRDYSTNAEQHKNNNHIINLDLKDFFDSITADIIKENLMMHPAFNVEDRSHLIDKIILIATYKGTTPQGSPLSPYLSNIILVNFDYRIRQKLSESGQAIKYTRYADDTTFSSKKSMDITKIIKTVEEILTIHYKNELKINYEKTKKITPGRCFITGVKLNQKHKLTVGWEKKKELKLKLYNLEKQARLATHDIDVANQIQQALGYIAFMNNVEPNYTHYLVHKSKYSSIITYLTNYLKQNEAFF